MTGAGGGLTGSAGYGAGDGLTGSAGYGPVKRRPDRVRGVRTSEAAA